MTEQSPIIPTIAPFFDDAAIAQTDNKAVVAVPTQPQQPIQDNNDLPKIGSAAIGGAVLVAMATKFFERFGSNIIDGQKSRLSLELRAKQLELESINAEKIAAIKGEQNKDEIIKQTLNSALANVYQGAAESREVFNQISKELQASNDVNSQAFTRIELRLNEQERLIRLIGMDIKDIFGILGKTQKDRNRESL